MGPFEKIEQALSKEYITEVIPQIGSDKRKEFVLVPKDDYDRLVKSVRMLAKSIEEHHKAAELVADILEGKSE